MDVIVKKFKSLSIKTIVLFFLLVYNKNDKKVKD